MGYGGFVMGDVPHEPDALSPGWMSEALGARVDEVRLEPLPRQGRASRTYRVHLAARDDALPTRVIAKCSLPSAAVQARRLSLGTYRLEVDFYRLLAPRLSGLVPRCFHASADDDSGHFVLLLEDLGDGSIGAQDPGSDIVAAAEAIARVHARLWGDASVTRIFAHCRIPSMFDQRVIGPTDRDITAGMLQGKLDGPGLPEVLVAAVRAELDNHPRFAEHLRSRPLTFAHGDYYLDQVLFPAAGTRIIDWQTSQLASGAMDLQRLLLVSKLTAPQRRQLEPAAIAAYHRALCEEGVDDYSLEELQHDYRLLLHHTLMWALMFNTVSAPERALWYERFVEPLQSALVDHDYVALIEAL